MRRAEARGHALSVSPLLEAIVSLFVLCVCVCVCVCVSYIVFVRLLLLIPHSRSHAGTRRVTHTRTAPRATCP